MDTPELNTREQRLWSEVVDADTPSAADMAAAEAELDALASTEAASTQALPPSVVEALVARATGSRSLVVMARRRTWRHKLVLLAAAMLMTVTIGWVGARVIWPERRSSLETTNFVDAVAQATQSWRGDAAQLDAIHFLAEHCGHGVDVLASLASTESLAPVARAAAELRAELAELIRRGASSPPGAVDLTLVESVAVAVNAALPEGERLLALRHLGDLVRSGITAILGAPLSGDDAIANRAVCIERLLRDLTN